MEKDSNVIEIMPDDVSDEIAAAIAEGRLCRYAVHLESQLTAEREKVEKLKDALKEITFGRGTFNHDPFQHCQNTVEDMKALAEQALADTEEDK